MFRNEFLYQIFHIPIAICGIVDASWFGNPNGFSGRSFFNVTINDNNVGISMTYNISSQRNHLWIQCYKRQLLAGHSTVCWNASDVSSTRISSYSSVCLYASPSTTSTRQYWSQAVSGPGQTWLWFWWSISSLLWHFCVVANNICDSNTIIYCHLFE